MSVCGQEDIRSLLGQLDDKQTLIDSKLKAAHAITAEAAAVSESSDSEGERAHSRSDTHHHATATRLG